MPEGNGAGDLEAWLAAFRRACDRVAAEALPLTPAERAAPVGRGAGGDVTVRIDRVAEDIVLAELASLGRPARVVSEEVGERALGPGEAGAVVVVDPIDGSINAKRGMPLFATSIALALGPRMGDVVLGLVRDHGTGEEFVARRGAGAWLGGRRLSGPPAPARQGWLELVLCEGAQPRRLAHAGAVVGDRAARFRALGSLALSICHAAAGHGDAMVGLGPGRAVDVAAAQLVAREAGMLVGMPRPSDTDGMPLDVETRYQVTVARDRDATELLLGALLPLTPP
jgi:myo-inositol-1(or 4)-monophosphatase